MTLFTIFVYFGPNYQIMLYWDEVSLEGWYPAATIIPHNNEALTPEPKNMRNLNQFVAYLM